MISSDLVLSLLDNRLGNVAWKITPLGTGRRWEVFKVEFVGFIVYSVRVRKTSDYLCPIEDRTPLPDGKLGSDLVDAFEKDGYHIEIWRYYDGISLYDSGPDSVVIALTSLLFKLRAIHRDQKVVARCPPFADRWWFQLIENEFIKSVDAIEADNSLKKPICDLIRAFSPNLTSLLHGDLSAHNVLVNPKDPTLISTIIDWDTARHGDYMWDLANLATFHEERGIPFLTRILQLYHGLHEKDSIHPQILLRFWVYFLINAYSKLASLKRIDPSLDLTRGRKRISMGIDGTCNCLVVSRCIILR